MRFTAPSVVFEADGLRLVAGRLSAGRGLRRAVANLDPTLERRPAPEDPEPLLEYFPEGLTTQEVAALLARATTAPDRVAAETALIELVAAGAPCASRSATTRCGWRAARSGRRRTARLGRHAWDAV